MPNANMNTTVLSADGELLPYLIEKRRALMTELKALEALIESIKRSESAHGPQERQVIAREFERK